MDEPQHLGLTNAGPVPAVRIVPGDMIRSRHRHGVPGMPCRIGCREIDVQVVAVTAADVRLVVECRGCPRFPGARAGMSLVLVLVLERTDPVMRIGHLDVAA
jgi:hypothetical protein